jgi:hypothetical protein
MASHRTARPGCGRRSRCGSRLFIWRERTASTTLASIGFAPISNPASKARARCWPIRSGVLSLAASSVAAWSVTTLPGATCSSSEALSTQSNIVALPVSQATEPGHRCAAADFFHLRTAPAVLELGVPNQHDRQLPTAFGDEFDETLQRDGRPGVEFVGVIDEQRRTWQRELAGERTHLIGAHLLPRLPMLAVAVQRDRATYWQERPAALFAVLDPKLLIEQPPPVSPASSVSTS